MNFTGGLIIIHRPGDQWKIEGDNIGDFSNDKYFEIELIPQKIEPKETGTGAKDA
jgi:hypothetical protein